MKRFKLGLLGSGLVASSVIGSTMTGDPLIGAAGGAAAFGALVVALKKIKGAGGWQLRVQQVCRDTASSGHCRGQECPLPIP